ncbi:dATP/dGTP diphosphohydrolase domain-containing protein [Terrisporobacter petrolearius]|uniref:dATP/dGTP diphosphohydrolase domain-containing protein n=1 Tax=Terrisporobacter petrolearius TaxID=1460447 RepID=UPI003B002A74
MILDSGDRTKYPTGAVRDIKEGKGRCDLMPLDVISNLMLDPFFRYINEFKNNQENTKPLYHLLEEYSYVLDKEQKHESIEESKANMILEVSKHFEEGAKKYGENNWQKGIPIQSYIDSACRHYLKILRGDKDEPHERALVWNILCCIWTVKHKKELGVD